MDRKLRPPHPEAAGLRDERGEREEKEASQDADFAAALGRAIKVFRTGIGMSRRELSDAASLSYSYVTEIENGKKQASAGAQKAIAAALGLSVSELLAAGEDWVGPIGSKGATEGAPAVDRRPWAEGIVRRSSFPGARAGIERPSPSAAEELRLDEEGARKRQLRWFHTAARQAHAARFASAPETVGADEAPAADMSLEDALRELRGLVGRMEPGDRARVLDLARRLAGRSN